MLGGGCCRACAGWRRGKEGWRRASRGSRSSGSRSRKQSHRSSSSRLLRPASSQSRTTSSSSRRHRNDVRGVRSSAARRAAHDAAALCGCKQRPVAADRPDACSSVFATQSPVGPKCPNAVDKSRMQNPLAVSSTTAAGTHSARRRRSADLLPRVAGCKLVHRGAASSHRQNSQQVRTDSDPATHRLHNTAPRRVQCRPRLRRPSPVLAGGSRAR